MLRKLVVFAILSWLAIQGTLDACTWANWIWAKDKLSDTPLFRFVVDGKSGYINASGKIAIPATFPGHDNGLFDDDDFFEGVASKSMLGTQFIDSDGALAPVSNNKIMGHMHFSEGLIPTTPRFGGKAGYADHNGRLVIGPNFDEVTNFSEGLAAVRVGPSWGYIDHAGKFVIPLRLDLAGPFSDGVARVIFEGVCTYWGHGPCAGGGTLGLDHYKGEWKRHYEPCEYAFIDRKGTSLSTQRFKDAYDFSEGLAAVRNGTRWGFINKSGVYEIPSQFEMVGSFSDGFAKFYRNGKWGYLDKSGRDVIPAQFEQANDFSFGAAVVGRALKTAWFIDKSGNKLFGKDFVVASPFCLGLAHVKTAPKRLRLH